jgi:predicted MFS family arabinose efflux permease
MFGAFSAFWTTIAFVLTGPMYGYSQLGVGLFALVGAAGALIAPQAGHWADRGLHRPMTAAALVCASAACVLAGLGRHSIVLLGLAAVLLDMGVQTTLLLGQAQVYALDPTSRARLNSAYIAVFFVGGATGSEVGSIVYHAAGWTGLTVLGGLLPALALGLWSLPEHGRA